MTGRPRSGAASGRWTCVGRSRAGVVTAGVVGLLAAHPPPALAQAADVILVGGTIVAADAAGSVHGGLAVRDGRIVALGTGPEVRALAGPGTRVVELGGRTVIPGLIDSHLHAIRAGLSFATEVSWTGARTLEEALGRIRAAARERDAGDWLIVAGGWTPLQFEERRGPTQAELAAVAPDHPVYVQLGYASAMLTPRAHAALGLDSEADLPPGARFERDGTGALTGGVTGGIVALFDRLPRPTIAEQVAGTRAFFRELNRLAITGVGDPGGNNVTPEAYQALFRVWRDGDLTVRVAYTLAGSTPGAELADLQALTAVLPMGFGDDLLRFNGLGERLTAAMNNNDSPSDADKEELYRLLRWAAGRGMSLTMHWGSDASVHHLLELFDRVNAEVPIAPLRWSIAHLNDASVPTLARMQALGVGWTVQDAMYFGGDRLLETAAPEVARRTPPVETARRMGVVVGAGTDAHRVASYNPFTALQWLLDGRSVSGAAVRGPEEIPDRLDALRFYTSGSAWFAFDEDERGSLEVGKLADLAVLSADYLTVPVDRVGDLESLLTMVGGRIVYAAGPFEGLEDIR